MIDVAVTNSTCLVGLERIGRLNILPQLIRTLYAPPAVHAEVGVTVDGLHVREVKGKALVAALSTQLDTGEAEAITLATEIEDVRLILDDKKARRIAEQMGFELIGTVGLLVRAKRTGVVPACKPLLDDLQQAGFRISSTLYQKALSLAGEMATS